MSFIAVQCELDLVVSFATVHYVLFPARPFITVQCELCLAV